MSHPRVALSKTIAKTDERETHPKVRPRGKTHWMPVASGAVVVMAAVPQKEVVWRAAETLQYLLLGLTTMSQSPPAVLHNGRACATSHQPVFSCGCSAKPPPCHVHLSLPRSGSRMRQKKEEGEGQRTKLKNVFSLERVVDVCYDASLCLSVSRQC